MQIIFGANHFLKMTSKNILIWDKGVTCRNRAFSDGELAWVSPDLTKFGSSGLRIYDGKQNEVADNEHNGAERIHATQKPIRLYKWILKHYANKGDKIFDSHLGSGSSRIAAWDLGFDFYGTEIEKEYFDAMNKRFENHIKQQKLFIPEQPKFEQVKLI